MVKVSPKENSRKSLVNNDAILKEVIIKRSKWCENGLTKMEKNES